MVCWSHSAGGYFVGFGHQPTTLLLMQHQPPLALSPISAADAPKIDVASPGTLGIGFSISANLSANSFIQFKLRAANHLTALSVASMSGRRLVLALCSQQTLWCNAFLPLTSLLGPPRYRSPPDGFLEPLSTLPNFPRTPTSTRPLTPSPTSKRLQSAWQPPRMLLLQPTTSRHLSLPTSAVPRLPSRSLGPLLLLQAPTHLACQAPALLSVFCPLSCSVPLLRVTLS